MMEPAEGEFLRLSGMMTVGRLAEASGARAAGVLLARGKGPATRTGGAEVDEIWVAAAV